MVKKIDILNNVDAMLTKAKSCGMCVETMNNRHYDLRDRVKVRIKDIQYYFEAVFDEEGDIFFLLSEVNGFSEIRMLNAKTTTKHDLQMLAELFIRDMKKHASTALIISRNDLTRKQLEEEQIFIERVCKIDQRIRYGDENYYRCSQMYFYSNEYKEYVIQGANFDKAMTFDHCPTDKEINNAIARSFGLYHKIIK